MKAEVREGGLEKLMPFPGLCPLNPYTRSGRIKWAGTRTCWQGLVNHTCQKGPKTIPYYKLALYKQYLQKILVPALCRATFFEMITCLCEVMACRQRQNRPTGVSIVLIMKEKKFLFLPLEGKSHSQIKCMI